jgi:tetratricopeptide (TPR) repeat protein
MMNPSLKLSIVSLNNEGLEMIMEGRYEQALDTFAAALHILSIQGDSCCQDQGFSNFFDRTVYCVHDHHKVLPIPIDTFDTDRSRQVGASTAETINVFLLPIFVVDENEPCCWDPDTRTRRSPSRHRGSIEKRYHRQLSRSTQTTLDFVVLYNLALCYHLVGLQMTRRTVESKTSLQNAIAFYEMAYRRLVDEYDVPISRDMAILSNMGQIHSHLNHKSSATACFQRLLSTMLVLHDQGDASTVEHWESFLSNVFCQMSPASPMKCFPASAA